ncbi:site-2 protease family protein [Actinomadura miaoliensis]|uniref:Zinc metalloprotease n=1 Tax=Actinomadura miaoliensis TaxID=430685 RepID=A0ABP7VYV1_9ACTN
MKQTVKLGSIAGIPVGVHWSVLAVLALIVGGLAGAVLPAGAPGRAAGLYWAVAVPTALLFLASLCAHEVAHALVARRNGVRVRSLTLWMLGGLAELADDVPSPGAELRITGVGPLVSALLGGVFLLAAHGVSALGGPALVIAPLTWLALINGILAVFNLLPGAPLDGGRILHALLWRFNGDRARSTRIATRTGTVLGYVLIAFGCAEVLLYRRLDGLWVALVGWFIAGAAAAEERVGALRTAVAGLCVRDVMTADPDHGASWSTVGAFVAEVARRSRQTVFPVVDFDGRPTGVVTLDLLGRVPPQATDVPLREIAVALAPDHVVEPDDPVFPLLKRPPVARELVAVVVEGGRLVGMVTGDDLTRLLRHSRLPGPVTEPEPWR